MRCDGGNAAAATVREPEAGSVYKKCSKVLHYWSKRYFGYNNSTPIKMKVAKNVLRKLRISLDNNQEFQLNQVPFSV